MNDPYQVLGISPDASDEEVKKAYRDMAKKYHPDNYANTEFSDVANEKMKAINEAYDAILKERAERGRAASSGSSAGESRFPRVRSLLQSGRFTEADALLGTEPDGSAEWYYLKGLCAMYARRYNEAAGFFSRASAMDPGNEEYASMYRRFHHTGPFGSGEAGRDYDCCSACSALLCADCMCEMCGGDLIGCC